MKTIDKKEVLSGQSAAFIEQSEEGKFLKIISDTFIIKTAKGTQGYAIRHLNMHDMLLIDTTGEGAQSGIRELVAEGYVIKGILLTGKEPFRNRYASLQEMAKDAGGAPIFMHPMNYSEGSYKIQDITVKHKIFDHFSLEFNDFPGENGENTVIYSGINEGMVFTGACAQGAPYNSEGNRVTRPDFKSENKNYSLAESWRGYLSEFRYFLPYKGKPVFNIEEGEATDLIQRLGNISYPGGGNPNL